MTTVHLEYVLDLAHQLPRRQRAELIARLARELADDLIVDQAPAPGPTAPDAWERLAQFRAELATLYPHADIGGRLDADRRERDALLTGREERDVHP